MDIEVDLAALYNIDNNIMVVANTAFRLLADDVVVEAKANIDPSRSGLHNRTGNLRDSIRVIRYVQPSPDTQGEALIAAGNAQVPYARIHEVGGVIRPVTKPFLVFQINGQWIRKKEVTIPSRPYLSPAAVQASENFQLYVDKAMDRLEENL